MKNPNSSNVCSGCGTSLIDPVSVEAISIETISSVPPPAAKWESLSGSFISETNEADGKGEQHHSIGKFDLEKLNQTNALIEDHIIDEISCQNDFIYILDSEASFASTEYKVVNSIGNKSLLKCKLIKYNGKDALYYMVGKLKSFEVMLCSLDSTRLMCIVENILNQVDLIKENGFLSNVGIDARMKRIYLDAQDGQVYLTYVPIKNRCYPDIMYLENSLRNDLACIIKESSLMQEEKIRTIMQMLEEPGCSFNSLLSAIRQNRMLATSMKR